jgi:hypothetical protein
VPPHHLALRGSHEAHPGTGKGYRARMRGLSHHIGAEKSLKPRPQVFLVT